VPARADGFAEEALRFGPGGRLFGVLATPESRPRAAALLLNAGRNRCIGWARGDVAEARRLASAGVAALRFDIAGVGDSAPEDGDEPLYDARRAADVVAALDLIEARFGPLPVALRGPCSGAFLGFAAAVQDARVKAAALINAQRYVWNPADDFDTVMRQPVHTVGISRRARDPRQIRRLLTGDIPARLALERLTTMLGRAAQARLGRAGLGLTSQARAIAEGRRGFASLAARGLALKIIVSKGDRAIEELMLFFGDETRFARAHGGDALVRIEGADHNLTPPQARRAASAAFDALIAAIARD
jgi:alpha/beta superfamily hydrolase